MDKPKLLWHSNAPWAPTGYGQQTALFAPRLAKDYDVQISAFYGLEGAPMVFEDIPVLPGFGHNYGAEAFHTHAMRWFGNPHGGIAFTLMDVWVLPPKPLSQLDLVTWVPVDHDPVPPGVAGFLQQSQAVPIAMSRFGEEQLRKVGLDPLYCPHGIDTKILHPIGRKEAREKLHIPEEKFMVGCVAANKGNPSRKSLVAILQAFAEFQRRHKEAILYLHTDIDGLASQGVHLPSVIENLGIPGDAITHPDPYVIQYRPLRPQQMAYIYSAMDLFLNPAASEGFGIPVAEAQACGTPVVVTDFTAMPEVGKVGWQVGGSRFWESQRSWWMLPNVWEIVESMEECYQLSDVDRARLSKKARKHALQYDVDRVLSKYMIPALKLAQDRFGMRKPTPASARRWSVSVITAWKDHPEFLEDYRTAIETVQPDEVIIVDDGSKEVIDGAAYRFEESVGFSRANNKGLELATKDVVVFLNNDIRMVRTDWLDTLLEEIEPGVMVGAQLRDDPHCAVDGVTIPYLDGWCLACLREDFQQIGAWDTTYHEPSYYGDNDLSLRAKAAGMRLVAVPVGIEHLLNGTTDDDPGGRMAVTLANRKIYEERVRSLKRLTQVAA